VGSGTNAALTLLRAVADDAELGRATAAHQFLRNQGIAVGAALGGATVLLVVARRIGDLERVRDLLAGGGGATGPVAGAIADGFATAGLAGAAVIAAGALPLIALRRHLAPARARRGR
jgi:hypothetical protein